MFFKKQTRNQKGKTIISFLSEKPFWAHAPYLLNSLEMFLLLSMSLPTVSPPTSLSQTLALFEGGLSVPKEALESPCLQVHRCLQFH